MGEELTQVDSKKEINDRAVQVVFDSIAKVPQEAIGKYLIAERLLADIDEGEFRKGKRVSIAELAQIDPDGDKMASKVNTLHAQFGIPRRVSSYEARRMISDFAVGALEALRYLSVDAAAELDVATPEDLKQRIEERPEGATGFSPEWINKSRSALLEKFLRDNPPIRKKVGEFIKSRADAARAESHSQHERARRGETKSL